MPGFGQVPDAVSPAPGASTPGNRLEIVAVGDIMVHESQLKAHWDGKAEAYLFDDDFRFVHPHLRPADLTIGNFETTLAGPSRKYSGYPFFNTPDTLVPALASAGFDVLLTANNHSLDTGISGLIRTAQVVPAGGIRIVGTREKQGLEGILVQDFNGVRVGITGYSYETAMHGKSRTLNGSTLPASAGPLLDSFRPYDLEADLPGMEERVRLMRAKGAELVVFFFHWGDEYGKSPLPYQRELARRLASAGADIIFGSHPHVLQTVEMLAPEPGRQTLVAYSLGNFLSNQRYEFLQRRDTEDGLILKVTVERDGPGKPWRFVRVGAVPTWVFRFRNRFGKWFYRILPLPEALSDPAYFGADDPKDLWRVKNSWEQSSKVLAKCSGTVSIEKPLPLELFEPAPERAPAR